MPDLIRHPEGLESSGFRLEVIPMKIRAGMTTLIEEVICKQTLNKGAIIEKKYSSENLPSPLFAKEG